MSVVVVEDDAESLVRLSALLGVISGVEYLGGAKSLKEAKQIIDTQKPDIVLLDIHLGSERGFELFELVEFRSFKVIFCTAYEEYAIRAIRCAAIDYVLKPFSKNELEKALHRAKDKVMDDRHIELLIQNHQASGYEGLRIALSDTNAIYFVAINELVRAEATGNYTVFYTTNGGRILLSTTLGDYEKILVSYNFFRAHRSHLVNLRHVVRFSKVEGGSLIMSDGANINVARRRKDELFTELNKMTQ